MQRLSDLRGKSGDVQADTPAPTDEAVLLTEIRDLLREQRGP
jgi:large-conductance mechanosensitive channel